MSLYPILSAAHFSFEVNVTLIKDHDTKINQCCVVNRTSKSTVLNLINLFETHGLTEEEINEFKSEVSKKVSLDLQHSTGDWTIEVGNYTMLVKIEPYSEPGYIQCYIKNLMEEDLKGFIPDNNWATTVEAILKHAVHEGMCIRFNIVYRDNEYRLKVVNEWLKSANLKVDEEILKSAIETFGNKFK